MHSRNQIERFYLIDALRGIAALAVVVFHYHHFYLVDALSRPSLPSTSTFPWAGQVQFLYDHGHYAVQLFWVISGFVFAHVYFNRKTTLWEFSVARFARLYPLHFVTLIFVACIQAASLQQSGHWQIYGNNDLKHFGLQLLFASNWTTLSEGLSFNGPIWSVSYEMVAYGLFFIFLIPLRRWGLVPPIALSAICWTLAVNEQVDLPGFRVAVLSCSGYFFAGCAGYRYFERFRSQPMLIILAAAVLAICAGFAFQKDLSITGVSVALLLILALAERKFANAGSKLSALGDISYSLYLVHVPLQMCVLLFADIFFDGSRSFAEVPYLLPLYLIASVMVAHWAHRQLELPAGRAIRRRLLG